MVRHDAVEAALREATAELAAAEIEQPHRDARILLGHVLGVDQAGVLRRRGADLSSAELALFANAVARRAAHEPMATILGRREFWSLDFIVSPETLIPRPDTEVIVESAVALHAERPVRRILDLGTGTGCLLLAALTEFPGAWGLGVDLSPAAAAVALRNTRALRLADRAAIMVGRWVEAVEGRFDLILCNPPYIREADIAGLMPEVAAHEPRMALDGGADGLDPYRILFPEMHRKLAPGGTALFEFGIGQADALLDLARASGLAVVAVKTDLAGHPRVMIMRCP
ncbi:MAG: peptide chain release factor N(5)-glutamine methyltransferase [Proteobacteria bacterium]|nr:peptide chain release factor N(5)-glutamine methyltransferase [Pseudomonadota bacterium]